MSPEDGTPDLYPGFTDGDVAFTIQNDNPYAVEFTHMTPGTVTSSDEASCPASNVTVDSATGLSLTVAAGTTSGTLTIEDVVTMDVGAPDGCQGSTFDIDLTLDGMQTP